MRKLLLIAGLAALAHTARSGEARRGEARRGLTITWVDVEGGAATLMVTPAGESILMDAGWPGDRDAARIAKAAQAAGIGQIDHFIVSHWHTDHFGGVADLAKALPIKNFYDHSFPELPKSDITPALVENYRRATAGITTALKPGDEIKLKQQPGAQKVTLRIVAAHGVVLGEGADAPQSRTCDQGHASKPDDPSDNARSVAFVLKYGDWKFFDAGDLTWNVEHKLVCPKNLVDAVDVYQVTHHGADSSNHPALVGALEPRVAVMNNGAKKGGAAATVQTIKATKSIEGFFALHRNVTTTPADNAESAHTANDEEKCNGEPITLAVAANARSYTLSVPSKGTTKTFATK